MPDYSKIQYDGMMDTQHILDIYEEGVKTYLKSLMSEINNQLNGKIIEGSVRNKLETLLDLAGGNDEFIEKLDWEVIQKDETGGKIKELFNIISNKPKSKVASVAERELESFKLLFVNENSISKYIYEYELFYGTNKEQNNPYCIIENEEQELQTFMEKANKMKYERDELLEITREASNVSKIAEIEAAYEEENLTDDEADAPVEAITPEPIIEEDTAPVAPVEPVEPVAITEGEGKGEVGGRKNRYKHSFKSRKRKGGKKARNAHSMRKGKRRGTKGSRKI